MVAKRFSPVTPRVGHLCVDEIHRRLNSDSVCRHRRDELGCPIVLHRQITTEKLKNPICGNGLVHRERDFSLGPLISSFSLEFHSVSDFAPNFDVNRVGGQEITREPVMAVLIQHQS